jgi:hypothetical protein
LNLAAPDDIAVQCKLPPEALNDIAQDIRVVSERIGVKGCHDAPAPKIMDSSHHVTDEKLPPLPFPLLEAGDTSNNDIGSKPTPVAPKFCNRAVRCDQEREYVEAVRTFVVSQARTWAGDFLDGGQSARIVPWAAVDERIAVLVQFGLESRQVGTGPRVTVRPCLF